MSSAKSICFIISETCSMSFIYRMKSNVPNTDPCGTPQEISLYSDSFFFIKYYVMFPIPEIAYSICQRRISEILYSYF